MAARNPLRSHFAYSPIHKFRRDEYSPDSPLTMEPSASPQSYSYLQSARFSYDAGATAFLVYPGYQEQPRPSLEEFYRCANDWDHILQLWDTAWFGATTEGQAMAGLDWGHSNSPTLVRTSSMAQSRSYESFFPATATAPEPSRAPPPAPRPPRRTHIPVQALYAAATNHLAAENVKAMPASVHMSGEGAVQAAESHEIGVGTWANRQYRLLGAGEALQTSTGAPSSETEENELNQPSAGTLVSQALELHHQQLAEEAAKRGAVEQSDEEQRGAAWRWRFARRWHAEQSRPVEGSSLPHDGIEDALQYIHAGGGTGAWNMQISRQSTWRPTADGKSRENSLVCSQGLLLDIDDNSRQNSLTMSQGCGILGEATREVEDLNRRAAALLQQQRELEQQAESRWRGSATFGMGEDWIGNRLKTVEIDDWGGPFPFVLIKVCGRGSKQQLLVRGHNCSSEEELVAEAQRNMSDVAAREKLPVGIMKVMGGGVMEWSRDGGRTLYLHSGYVCSVECRHHVTQPSEILSLAGVLTKQQLPITCKLHVQGHPR